MEVDSSAADHFQHVDAILSNKSPFADESCFNPGQETIQYLRKECRVLVIGAGGLGCEILKDLALVGFSNISVIDMDHVELTNLNRQFLFRETDIGRPKAVCAAEAITNRLGHLGVKVTAHVGKIQDLFEPTWYRNFNVIIAGLDNIDARRWLNSTLHSLARKDANGDVDPSTIIPLLDGGTEGLKGQSRVILPFMTACFDCSLDSFPPQENYPLCTIAETPRLPEHCVEYALVIEWPKHFPTKKLDADRREDMQWLFEVALKRSQSFGIEGVTYALTMGVVKRIIPAVASTNALISAQLVQEALKISTYCGPVMDNYIMYMGHDGVYSHTFSYEKNPACMVCGGGALAITVQRTLTLQQLMGRLAQHPQYQLKRPSISSQNCVVFIQNPPVLRQQHEYKLEQSLEQLVADKVFNEGEPLIVTDQTLPSTLTLSITFS
eukprot:GEMP01055432.1.p1 GENE.GEMP01055432.1~~GEMP01055432.1.p1  ORF type:complete len:438 (-),score=105.24 GEMP01055432.1:104-1417(-)